MARRPAQISATAHARARCRADREGRRLALPAHAMCRGHSGVTAAVILAAGASTRLGQPKQLIQLGGETLLERAVRVADEAGCWPTVVVLGADARRVLAGCSLRSV